MTRTSILQGEKRLFSDTFFGEEAVVSGMKQSGEVAFKRQLYQSALGQLLFLKTEIESWRSSNLWGSTCACCS
jgi:hypothetical protein